MSSLRIRLPQNTVSPKHENPIREPDSIANALIQNKFLEQKYKKLNLNNQKAS